MLATIFLVIGGVISTQDIMKGLSNEAIGTIVLLLIITAGIRKNFPLEVWLDHFFSRANSYPMFLLRMMGQVSLVSSIINNTPVVALLTPYVVNWGKKHGVSPSKLLIPLSFATIMGGMITIIGTSTTLVLNGFLMEYKQPLLNPMMLLIIGGAVTVTGIVFMVLIGFRFLPDRRDLLEKFNKNRRDYLVETELTPQSELIGKEVSEAGLRNLKGVYLVEILRDGSSLSPVGPNEKIEARDRLIFAGDTEDIVDLVNSKVGIKLPEHSSYSSEKKVNVHEAVISPNSSLVGQTVKDCRFRERYDAGIVAIQRDGEKLEGKIGDIIIRPGDLMLLFSGPQFEERIDLYRDIFLINHVKEISTLNKKQIWALLLMATSAILLFIQGASLFFSLLFIFAILAALGLITLRDIKRELDLELIAILVLSLAIGKAIISTDLGEMLAQNMVSSLKPFGNLVLVAGLMITTILLTGFVTNVAAVSIMFPVGLGLITNYSMPAEAVYLAIAYGASAAFLTPIGYQTNLIIYGPGGYNFKDFIKIGIPVTLIYLITVMTALTILFF